jgi:predicted DNA-binding WGR domain protein
MPTFHCKEGSSNKFWSYEVDGNTVNIEYGRVGGRTTKDKKSFPTTYARDRFIDKKVREKKRKNYNEIDETEKVKETTLAEGLGTRDKVMDISFVKISKVGKRIKLQDIGDYDPEGYIFVKLINSWNKTESFMLVSEHDISVSLVPSSPGTYYERALSSAKSTAIVQYLNDILSKFEEIVTASFGSLGGRALDDDSLGQVVDSYKQNEGSEISDNVLGKIASMAGNFGSLGGRALDI